MAENYFFIFPDAWFLMRSNISFSSLMFLTARLPLQFGQAEFIPEKIK